MSKVGSRYKIIISFILHEQSILVMAVAALAKKQDTRSKNTRNNRSKTCLCMGGMGSRSKVMFSFFLHRQTTYVPLLLHHLQSNLHKKTRNFLSKACLQWPLSRWPVGPSQLKFSPSGKNLQLVITPFESHAFLIFSVQLHMISTVWIITSHTNPWCLT